MNGAANQASSILSIEDALSQSQELNGESEQLIMQTGGGRQCLQGCSEDVIYGCAYRRTDW